MTTAKTHLTCSILTPQTVLIDDLPVTIAICPGEEGDLGVMNGHTPLVTTLRTGLIQLRQDDKVLFQMSIQQKYGGLLNIQPHHVTMTLDTFCPVCDTADLSGFEVMPKVLRIECATCGNFKIESDSIGDIHSQNRETIFDYLKTRPSAYVTKDLIVSITKDKKAA